MLQRTLSTQFVPGTNLRGDVTGANWIYLLPTLALEHSLVLGAPSRASLAALVRLGRVSIAADPSAVADLLPLDRWGDVALVAPDARGALPVLAESVDLVLLVGGADALDQAVRAEITRVLRPEGLLWAEIGGPRGWLRRAATLDPLRADLGGAALYWLTPLSGEVHTAVPLSHDTARRYFLDRHLYSPTLTLERLKHMGRRLNGSGLRSTMGQGSELSDGDDAPVSHGLRARAKGAVFGLLDGAARVEGVMHRALRPAARCGVLAGHAISADAAPPAYLRELAAARGIDLTGYRWGLWAAGAYSSRKLLFYLFPPGESAPAFLVKMVRDPAFNDRLENEWRALDRLAAFGLGEGVLPHVPFAGQHAGLAIVAESAVEGRPFREVARWSAGDPALRAGIDWLTMLGARTANASTSPAAADVLAELLARFCAVYRLDAAHERFLAGRIAALRQDAERFPLVFQHGDPGTWNVLVTPRGDTVFVDWESAEPDGVPLWDLFYFLRSYVVGAARSAGQHDRLAGFAAHFIERGSLSDVLVEAVRRYRDEIGLSGEVAETLFYMVWLHRALKQSTLLSPARVDRDGHYANLLRLCLERREGPTMQRLFGT